MHFCQVVSQVVNCKITFIVLSVYVLEKEWSLLCNQVTLTKIRQLAAKLQECNTLNNKKYKYRIKSIIIVLNVLFYHLII